MYFSHLLTNSPARFALSAICSTNSAQLLLLEIPVSRQKSKKIPQGGANRQDAPGAKLSFGQKEAGQPEESRGRPGLLGAAALAAPSPGGLQVALRAQGRGHPAAPPAPSSARGPAARHSRARLLSVLQARFHLGERSGYRCNPFAWRCLLW